MGAAAHVTDGPLTKRGIRQLADGMADGTVTAIELVEAHIARIEAVNPHLNAVTARRYDAAREEAVDCDRRRRDLEPRRLLDGIPITVKDTVDVAGLPTTAGLPSRATHRAVTDDPHVARLRRAGAIVLAKTNVAQMAGYYETDNPLFGRTNNPWALDRSPGGSSGGEAALIAACASPLGVGTDIGGSLRVPAAFCGIASLKATAGRFPDRGRLSFSIGERSIGSQLGLLARTTSDLVHGLAAMSVVDATEGWSAVPLSFGDSAAIAVTRLRVGVYVDDGTFATAPSVARAVRRAAAFLAAAGATIVEWRPPNAAEALELFVRLLSADGGESIRDLLAHDPIDRRLKGLTRFASLRSPVLRMISGVLRGAGQPGLAAQLRGFGNRDTARYWRSVASLLDYREEFLRALDDTEIGALDVLLAPPCALPPFTHGASERLLTAGAYAVLYNVLGLPAGVVPVSRVTEHDVKPRPMSRDLVQRAARAVEIGSVGLPLGVQVVGRPWREDIVIAAMRSIEDAAFASGEHPGNPPIAGSFAE
jgi:fatty acid amide hydrolase